MMAKTKQPNPKFQRIRATIMKIPHGHVSSYGAVARAAGIPRGARLVVRTLSQSDAAILRVFKMKALLGMFAQGRTVKESAMRKKVMWANVMKKFINQAAQRSMSPAAAA